MSLWERLVRRLRRLFRRKRWYEIDMRRFVQEENARHWREVRA